MQTFEQHLSAAAESSLTRYNHKDQWIQYEMRTCGRLSFKEGARWALQSELIKELEAALKQCHLEMKVTVWREEQVFYDIEQALQKLKEARGEL